MGPTHIPVCDTRLAFPPSMLSTKRTLIISAAYTLSCIGQASSCCLRSSSSSLLATHAWSARVSRPLKCPFAATANRGTRRMCYVGSEAFPVIHSIFPQQGVNYGELQETAYELILP